MNDDYTASKTTPSRRTFLSGLVGVAGLFGAGEALARCLDAVPTDEGPFYPVGKIPKTADLTRRQGKGRARGRLLYLHGRVTDAECTPLRGARVEIWQADDRGLYWHPRAAAQDDLDPEFAYFGHTITGADGRYVLKTIVPSKYTFMNLERAPHVHFKIKHPKFELLTTEMYFAGEADDALRADDRVWESRPAAERGRLIVAFRPPADVPSLARQAEADSVCCEFDLRLEPRKA